MHSSHGLPCSHLQSPPNCIMLHLHHIASALPLQDLSLRLCLSVSPLRRRRSCGGSMACPRRSAVTVVFQVQVECGREKKGGGIHQWRKSPAGGSQLSIFFPSDIILLLPPWCLVFSHFFPPSPRSIPASLDWFALIVEIFLPLSPPGVGASSAERVCGSWVASPKRPRVDVHCLSAPSCSRALSREPPVQPGCY